MTLLHAYVILIIIAKFAHIAERLNVNYSLMYGTLLGSYREHGFIRHDDDIDIAVYRPAMTLELIEEMEKVGFLFSHSMLTDDGTRMHVAFRYKGVKFDLYSYNIDVESSMATSCVPRPIDGDWPLSKQLKKARVLNMNFPYSGFQTIRFEGTNVTIWANANEVLSINYGADFMTPIKGVKAKTNKNIYIDDLETRSFLILTKEELCKKVLRDK